MNRRWLTVYFCLLIGCGQKPQVQDPPPRRVGTDFNRLPIILAELQTKEVVLYEGLPSQFWEPQVRESQLREKPTRKVLGSPFYEQALALEQGDAEQLTRIFSAPSSFKKYRADKQCGDFHSDYCVEWGSGDEATRGLISLECGEVEVFGAQGEVRCDFTDEVAQKVRQMLGGYVRNRPKSDAAPSISNATR